MAGQARHGGYGSDREYREAIAAEVDALNEVQQAMISKPLHGSELAREAAPSDDLLIQATDKLAQALTTHRGELGAAEAFGTLGQMLEGTNDPEAAALAVVAFSSTFPDYSPHAVEAMREMWGDWADEALEGVVNQIAAAEAEQESAEANALWDAHVEHRSDVVRGLSQEIARHDGEDVRAVTAALASQDETLAYGDDVDATSALMGHRQVAKDARSSVVKEGFLRELDRELEVYGPQRGSDAQRDHEGFMQQQSEATDRLIEIDPASSYERGHRDAVRRVRQEVVGLPFDERSFDEEAAKYNKPAHSTSEAHAERDARERAEHIRLYGEPPPRD